MTFVCGQKVLFKHCDPAGIVFYPRYFEMINDAVEEFFDVIVKDPFEKMHATHGVPTVQAHAQFQAPSRHGDVLEIAIRPTRLGSASLDLNVTATCKGETRFSADVTLVRVRKDMSSDKWTAPIRTVLSEQMNSDEKERANG